MTTLEWIVGAAVSIPVMWKAIDVFTRVPFTFDRPAIHKIAVWVDKGVVDIWTIVSTKRYAIVLIRADFDGRTHPPPFVKEPADYRDDPEG